MARRSPVGRYNMGLVVRVNEKDAIVRVVPEPWPALGDVRRRMTLGQLELKEDEACVIEPRPPVDEAVFAQLESGLEGETESSP
jgi:hypothetical protein